MEIELIRFEQVFDVAAYHGNFSYRSAGRTHYGVKIRNGVIPHPGSTYAIAFGRAGDWSTVQGWRDLSAETVDLMHPAWSTILQASGHLYFVAPALIAFALALGGRVSALVATAFVVALAAYLTGRVLWNNRAVTRALRAAGTQR